MWYVIIGLIVISIALIPIIRRFLLSCLKWGKGQTFVCSECGNEFYVTAFKIYLSGYIGTGGGINDENKRMLKCPACGKKCLCVMKDHRI